MFNGLLNSYVKAINDGAVPNIENAWSYVCKNECQKVNKNMILGCVRRTRYLRKIHEGRYSPKNSL